MCIKSSTPVLVLNKIPCLLSIIEITVPSAGAYTFPSVGIIATPSPTSLSEKVLSGTFDNFSNVPAIGEYISILSTSGFSSILSSSIFNFFFFYYGLISLNPNKIFNINEATKETMIIITPASKLPIPASPINAGIAIILF